MSFPLSPTNGQTAVLNGITYSYSSASTLWTRVTAAVPNTSKSTSSATSPANPNIGDIWYNTTTDDIYRYTSDGVTSYWLDITGASTTLTTGAASALVVSQPTYAVGFGGTSQYLSVANNTPLNLDAAFTFEGWFNFTPLSGSADNIFYSKLIVTPSTTGVELGVKASGSKLYAWLNGADRILGSTTIVSNTWYHLAITRDSSNNLRLFVNGVSDATAVTYAGDTTTTAPAYIAAAYTPAGRITGSISNFRIVKGAALYTASFAVPSAPLTATTNTSLLTCQNVPITDASTNNAAVTNVGGASLAIYAAPTVSYASQTLYYRLNTAYVGTNATGAQSVFGVGVTLSSNTAYGFEGLYLLFKTAGATPHTVSTLFGGTATVNNIAYDISWNATTSYNVSDPGAYYTAATQTAAVVITNSRSNAGEYAVYRLSGTVSINAGGTFIPQYTLSAAPGGAYTTAAGSYITFTPIGAASANSSLGTWA